MCVPKIIKIFQVIKNYNDFHNLIIDGQTGPTWKSGIQKLDPANIYLHVKLYCFISLIKSSRSLLFSSLTWSPKNHFFFLHEEYTLITLGCV